MKAVVCTKYGAPDVLELREVDKPVPKDREVRVRNFATAVTGSDVLIRGSEMPLFLKLVFRLLVGIRRPRKSILGLVFAGEVESVGKNVRRFQTGDQVYGFTGYSFGTYAEYLCLAENESKRGCLAKKSPQIGMWIPDAKRAML